MSRRARILASRFPRSYEQACLAEHLPTATQWQAGADSAGIRVAEYCPVINQWHLPLRPRGDRKRPEVMLWLM